MSETLKGEGTISLIDLSNNRIFIDSVGYRVSAGLKRNIQKHFLSGDAVNFTYVQLSKGRELKSMARIG